MLSRPTVRAPRARHMSSTAAIRLTGRWSFVSGCELASWMVLWAVVHDGGKPHMLASGAPDIRFMLLPARQCEIIDTWTVGGLRGTGSHDVVVNDVFVPSPFSAGFFDPHVLSEPRYRIPPFSRVIPGLGAMALGIARTAIESLKEIAGVNPGPHHADAARYDRRANAGVASRGTGTVCAAVSVRQRRPVMDGSAGHRRGNNGGAGASSTGRFACSSPTRWRRST